MNASDLEKMITMLKARKFTSDRFINDNCVHLDCDSRDWDTGHNWGTEYTCKICKREVKFNHGLSDIEKNYQEYTWNLIKQSDESRKSDAESIKYYEELLLDTTLSPTEIKRKYCKHATLTLYGDGVYKCTDCDITIKCA